MRRRLTWRETLDELLHPTLPFWLAWLIIGLWSVAVVAVVGAWLWDVLA